MEPSLWKIPNNPDQYNLSDIHFTHRTSGGHHELNRDLRKELENDAVRLISEEGRLDGIVVSGDVAFSGKREEYEQASEWLAALCHKLGCPEQSVWTVPGNHDVDWDEVRNSKLLRSLREELRGSDPRHMGSRLDDWLRDSTAGPAMLKPLAHYNDFAESFGCAITCDPTYWEHDFPLNDGSTLRMRGVTSVFVSDDNDDQYLNRMVAGSWQFAMEREEGVEYLVVCHHPPDWLLDADMIEDYLITRGRLQLFGHKHRQRLHRINDCVRMIAGAVHPDRAEADWDPRYNLVSIAVGHGHGERTLELTINPRVWRPDSTAFVADTGAGAQRLRHCSLPIEDWAAAVPVAPASTESRRELPQAKAPVEQMEGGVPLDANRRLSYRFMRLPYRLRLAVAQELDLIEDEDQGVDDIELYRRFFSRANDREQLADLWDAVEARHTDRAPVNPFRG